MASCRWMRCCRAVSRAERWDWRERACSCRAIKGWLVGEVLRPLSMHWRDSGSLSSARRARALRYQAFVLCGFNWRADFASVITLRKFSTLVLVTRGVPEVG